ncbi:MAG TPA: hypothetical protein VFT74_09220, partial [Isosphaeraceae bacterium]|nr:hypothetical protein [Isosphaeraceae bacterium]
MYTSQDNGQVRVQAISLARLIALLQRGSRVITVVNDPAKALDRRLSQAFPVLKLSLSVHTWSPSLGRA